MVDMNPDLNEWIRVANFRGPFPELESMFVW